MAEIVHERSIEGTESVIGGTPPQFLPQPPKSLSELVPPATVPSDTPEGVDRRVLCIISEGMYDE